jgi:hypothetical protein
MRLAKRVIAALFLIGSCRTAPGHARGIYVAHSGPHLLTMELRDSNRGILRPDISLTYALTGDTLIIQADPRGTAPPSPPSRFLVRHDTLHELNTSTPLVFVRQRD